MNIFYSVNFNFAKSFLEYPLVKKYLCSKRAVCQRKNAHATKPQEMPFQFTNLKSPASYHLIVSHLSNCYEKQCLRIFTHGPDGVFAGTAGQ